MALSHSPARTFRMRLGVKSRPIDDASAACLNASGAGRR
jgi:hypothetical protein